MKLTTRDKYLRRTYGITEQQYNQLLAKQGGGCAICGKTKEQERRNLAVDHDHRSREIFGVLCMLCNKVLIGRIRDPIKYQRAAEYLKQGTGLFVPKHRKKRRKRRKK